MSRRTAVRTSRLNGAERGLFIEKVDQLTEGWKEAVAQDAVSRRQLEGEYGQVVGDDEKADE